MSSSPIDKDSSAAAATTLQTHDTSPNTAQEADDMLAEMAQECSGGLFRGLAAAFRKAALTKTIVAKKVAAKSAVRSIGENRALAFASEGAVAGESIMPRVLYYSAWTLSGVAICADIYNRQDDAPVDKKWQTAVYWTAFHIPASLVVPAMIIHQVVHQVQHVVENPLGMAKAWSPRVKAAAPVAAALFSIIPVVPVVDTAAEYIMEPTLGAYLGLDFDHHGHGEEKKEAVELSNTTTTATTTVAAPKAKSE